MNLKAIPITQDKDTHYYVFVSDEIAKYFPLDQYYFDEDAPYEKIQRNKKHLTSHDRPVLYQSKPIHEGIPVIEKLPWEFNLEKFAYDFMMKSLTNDKGEFVKSTIGSDDNKSWFKIGYSKAKETFMFTEEDMRKAIKMSKESVRNGSQMTSTSGHENLYEPKYSVNEIIQSLKQPKVYQVEIAQEDYKEFCGRDKNGELLYDIKFKPIIKSWKEL